MLNISEYRQFHWNTNRDLHIPYSTVSFRMTLSDLSFFLFWGGTRSLHMPALRLASQAGSVRNPREGTSVVLRDTIILT